MVSEGGLEQRAKRSCGPRLEGGREGVGMVRCWLKRVCGADPWCVVFTIISLLGDGLAPDPDVVCCSSGAERGRGRTGRVWLPTELLLPYRV